MAKSSTSFKKGIPPRGKPFVRGQIPWNKGKPMPDEIKAKVSASRKGKGTGEHLKARRRIIKVCPRCGKEFETGGRAGDKEQIYCSRHCAAMTRNGRTMHTAGYVQIIRDGKRMLEHRAIAGRMLGRPLTKSEIVHHIDGNKLNNEPKNLAVMSQACHRALVDHLARLWVIEHQGDDDRIIQEAKDFQAIYGLRIGGNNGISEDC